MIAGISAVADVRRHISTVMMVMMVLAVTMVVTPMAIRRSSLPLRCDEGDGDGAVAELR